MKTMPFVMTGPLLAISILLAGATAALASGPAPPPSAAAIQAWVFDGAYQAPALYGLAFTDSGLVGHALHTGEYRCPDGSGAGPSRFLQLSASLVGVFTSPQVLPLGFGPSLDPGVLAPLPPPPLDPALTATDCAALQNESAVQAYVADLQADASALLTQVAACLQDVRQLVCDANAALEQLRAFCQANPDSCIPNLDLVATAAEAGTAAVDSSFGAPEPCTECAQALAELRSLVAAAEFELDRCDAARSWLQAVVNAALAAATPNGAKPEDRAYILENAPSFITEAVSKAESAFTQAKAIVSGMPAIAASCSHDSLAASCELCGPGPFEPVVLAPSGVVSVRQSTRHLGRLAGSFQSAASTTSDPTQAARLSDIARRLQLIPDDRVLEVAAPSRVPFSQQFVALRSASAPDDGHSPLAVVVTTVRSRGEDPPALNRADRELLQQAFEAFKNTLAPGRSCSTCEPPR